MTSGTRLPICWKSVRRSLWKRNRSSTFQHLGIGGKDDPARLIFNTQTGPAIVASLIDLGDRYRLLVNLHRHGENTAPLPKLPAANALWKAQPDLPNCFRSVDPRWWRAPYRFQPCAEPQRYAPVRRDARH